MKNISKSVAMIAAVAAIAIGGTVAYFSDTETSTGNTLTAGTIDIAIDGQNPVTKNFNIGDLKPGETGSMTFKVQNVGTNPAEISKSLYNFTPQQTTKETYNCHEVNTSWNYSASSEPECVAENGAPVDNVQTQLYYGLEVKVYSGDDEATPIWWQTIYKGSDNKTLDAVYGSHAIANDAPHVQLGVVPPGGHMVVAQTYKFNPESDNKYQGDGLNFDMEIKADQLVQNANGQATIAMENKGGAPDWVINSIDAIGGTLTYNTAGTTLNTSFTGKVATDGNYTLIYVGTSGDYPATGSVVLAQGALTTAGGTISGIVTTSTITNGKVWLVPTADYNSGQMTAWHNDQNLFETGLMNYTKN